MKKYILSFAVAAAIIGCIATGCSSQKAASGSDSTSMKDSAKMTDTSKMVDTTKKDTSKKM